MESTIMKEYTYLRKEIKEQNNLKNILYIEIYTL